jgi:hypothetical protein
MHVSRVWRGLQVLAVLMVLAAGRSHAGFDPAAIPRPRAGSIPLKPADVGGTLQGDEYDVVHYTIDLRLVPDSTVVVGNVRFEYVAGPSGVSAIEFNLAEPFIIDTLIVPVEYVEFTHEGDVVTLYLATEISAGDTSSFNVFYRGVPPPPTDYGTLYFTNHGGQPVIYSISWPDNARNWWPCKDLISDKATAVLNLTVPGDLTAASNGKLTGTVDNGDGTRTFTWEESYPVTTYNVCVAISNYEQFQQFFAYAPGDSMPLPFYVYPEDREIAEEDWSMTAAMLAVYDSVFGEYPFLQEKYGMAEVPTDPFAAMEHQTLTSYGDLLVTGNHRYDMIVAHELAHSWWGNCVTPAAWEEIWLSEGFATYSEALWAEHLGGLPEYLAYMRTLDTGNFTGPLYDPVDLLGETVYNKGAWVMHMLRGVVGDSSMFAILPAFATDPSRRYGHATTTDLIAVSEALSGTDLDWFFEEWVYGEGEPNYLTTWQASNTSGSWEATVTIEQVQAAPTVFEMPLRLFFVSGPDTIVTSVYDSTRILVNTFSLPWEPEQVLLDPEGWVLKSITNPLEITTTHLDSGFVGILYNEVLRAQGGIGTRHWSIIDGTLPPGLTLNPDVGLISGTPTAPDSFPFLVKATDSANPPHTDEVWLSIVIEQPTGIEKVEGGALPREFSLLQNFPNPFNPATVIGISVPAAEGHTTSRVLLVIYDVRGRKVRTLLDGDLSPGHYRILWDGLTGSSVRAPSGVYIYRFTSGEWSFTRKMTLAR